MRVGLCSTCCFRPRTRGEAPVRRIFNSEEQRAGSSKQRPTPNRFSLPVVAPFVRVWWCASARRAAGTPPPPSLCTTARQHTNEVARCKRERERERDCERAGAREGGAKAERAGGGRRAEIKRSWRGYAALE